MVLKKHKNAKIAPSTAKQPTTIGNPTCGELKSPTRGNVKTATVIDPELAPKYLKDASEVLSSLSCVIAGISEPTGIAIIVYRVVNVI